MIELEENLRELNELKARIDELKDSMNIDKLNIEVEALESETLKDGFWNDIENSSKVNQKLNKLRKKISSFKTISSNFQNLIEMNSMLESDFDEELFKEQIKATKILSNEITHLETETLLSGKYDANNAILTLHPGAGGTESQDWVEMLYRMYSKWAASNRIYCKRIRLFRRR